MISRIIQTLTQPHKIIVFYANTNHPELKANSNPNDLILNLMSINLITYNQSHSN